MFNTLIVLILKCGINQADSYRTFGFLHTSNTTLIVQRIRYVCFLIITTSGPVLWENPKPGNVLVKVKVFWKELFSLF